MTGIASLELSPEKTTLQIGAPGPAFEGLRATDGEIRGSSSYADRDALVLIFSSNRCPTAKAYAERMNALQRDYAERGLQVVAINSNDPHLYPDESLPRMVERAAEDAYTFPYLADADQRVARAYGPTCPFYFFLLDRERRLVMRSGAEVHLAPIEFRLLACLAQLLGLVVTHRQLLREVWGPSHVEHAHYLRVYMKQLRDKLEADPVQPKYLLTDTGIGYRLLCDDL